MKFEWDENKAEANLSKHEEHMKKSKEIREDDLRPEYDLENLEVRKIGNERKSFGKSLVHLEPDVVDVFPDSESVNEALRFLIRITKKNKQSIPDSK